MKASDMQEVQNLLAQREGLVKLISDIPQLEPRAVELKSTLGIVVFSNTQPAANYPLSERVAARVLQAIKTGLYDDVAAVDSELKALHVEPPEVPPKVVAKT